MDSSLLYGVIPCVTKTIRGLSYPGGMVGRALNNTVGFNGVCDHPIEVGFEC